MNLFLSLPADIQRLVCYFLSSKEYDKLSSPVTESDGIFWKEKAKMLTCREINYKFLYTLLEKLNNIGDDDALLCAGLYQAYLSKKLYLCLNDIERWINDEFFLQNHIDVVDINGHTPLVLACIFSKIEWVKKLLNRGANINHRTVEGFTPLLVSVKTTNANIEITKYLLQAGANVKDVEYRDGKNILMMLHNLQDLETLKILIEAGADVNHQDAQGYTPLMYFISKYPLTTEEHIKTFIDAGADLTLKNHKGETVLYIAKECDRFVDIIEQGL